MFLIIWYFMNLLFPDEFILPPGFSYIPEFISKDEEKKLLEDIQTIELTNMKFQQYVAKRKTASFGYDWSFDKSSSLPGGIRDFTRFFVL